MRVANIGDNSDLRFGERRQHTDFARMIHPEFQHAGFGSVGHTQQRKRQSQVVIQISRRLPHFEAGGEQLGDGIFGRGLAGASGDGDNRLGPTAARPQSKDLKGSQGVGAPEATGPSAPSCHC